MAYNGKFSDAHQVKRGPILLGKILSDIHMNCIKENMGKTVHENQP